MQYEVTGMKWFWYEVTGNRSDERYQQQTQQILPYWNRFSRFDPVVYSWELIG